MILSPDSPQAPLDVQIGDTVRDFCLFCSYYCSVRFEDLIFGLYNLAHQLMVLLMETLNFNMAEFNDPLDLKAIIIEYRTHFIDGY